MNRDSPLDLLIDQTREQLDEAGKALAALNGRRRDAQRQLGQLDAYRLDYAQRLHDTLAHGVTASNYHNFRQFLETLDQAITQQNMAIAQIDAELEAGRRHWLERNQRLNAYATLKTRQDGRHRIRQARLEQRISDEAAAGMLRRDSEAHRIR